MSRVRVHNFAISLDGFGTGEGMSLEAPFGHAGHRLHTWLLGRGVRLWDGLEDLQEGYDVEAVPSPSGVTHLVLTRKA